MKSSDLTIDNRMRGPETAAGGSGDASSSKQRIREALFGGRPLEAERLGRFVVRGLLGQGGMGTVLEAHDPSLDRTVALKVLHPSIEGNDAQRMTREARALAKLSHPNVVGVHEVGDVDGRTFIAMELVRGQTLDEWQARSPRPNWRACVDAYLQAAKGLVAAHDAGLVHRDFKPGNCIIDPSGRVRVLDFGLVRSLGGEDPGLRDEPAPSLDPDHLANSLTRTGAVLGTVSYMAPEQLSGLPVDARSDQFSFCVSLYEALYGKRPFGGDTVRELTRAVLGGTVGSAPSDSGVPDSLRRVLLRGLAPEPEQRWPSMKALLEQLQQIVAPRIRRVSRGVKLVAYALFWICVIVTPFDMWIVYGVEQEMDSVPRLFLFHQLAMLLVWAALFWQVTKLAELYEQGKLFTAANVRRLRAIGLMMIPCCVDIEMVAGSTPGEYSSSPDVHPSFLVFAFVVLFVSWIMDEARRMHERGRVAEGDDSVLVSADPSMHQ